MVRGIRLPAQRTARSNGDRGSIGGLAQSAAVLILVS